MCLDMPITTPTPSYTRYMHTQRRSSLFDVKERERSALEFQHHQNPYTYKRRDTHIVTILLHYRKQSNIND